MADRTPDEQADKALRERLDTLSSRLSEQRPPREAEQAVAAKPRDAGMAAAMATGMRATTELVAGVAVGGLMGWQVDRWFATGPWGLLIFLVLGVIAGFWNLFRLALAKTGAGAADTLGGAGQAHDKARLDRGG